MEKTQIISFSLFHFEGIKNKWWAFVQMGKAKDLFGKTKGLQFYKMVGSGGGNGFSIFPNFGVYGLLCVWDNETSAKTFFDENPIYQQTKITSSQYAHLLAETITSHGTWEGYAPFVKTTDVKTRMPVAVLTRATIKWRFLPYFWRFVPRTSKSIYEQSGRLFSVGIGELPLIQQATFSLWTSMEEMKAFAYKSAFHNDVIQKTRQLGWYKEELFARFHPYEVVGDFGTFNTQTLIADKDNQIKTSL